MDHQLQFNVHPHCIQPLILITMNYSDTKRVSVTTKRRSTGWSLASTFKEPKPPSHTGNGISTCHNIRLATGWTVQGSNPCGGEIFRTHPDQSWGPPSLLYNGYRVFPRVESSRGMMLTTYPLLVQRSKKSIAIPLLSLQAFMACKKGETYLPQYWGFSSAVDPTSLSWLIAGVYLCSH
jgi:hypothetical protein